MKIEGACHCGYITYKAEMDPKHAGICHCADCQMLSGSAFRTLAFYRERAPYGGYHICRAPDGHAGSRYSRHLDFRRS